MPSEAAIGNVKLDCVWQSKISLTSPLLYRLLWHASVPDSAPVHWLLALPVHSGSSKAAQDCSSELDHALAGIKQHRHQSFEGLQPLRTRKMSRIGLVLGH